MIKAGSPGRRGSISFMKTKPLMILAALVLAACFASCSTGEENTWQERAEFTGSESCRPCHEDFFKLWADSHHGLALQAFDRDFPSRNLTPQAEGIRIENSDFQIDGSLLVEKSGENIRQHEIKYAMGGKNVYYFLTERERGHLQVLPLAYDSNRQEWYDTTASMVRHFPDQRDESVDWTDRSLTFNTSCYNCHVSQLSTNYDLSDDSYQTSWLEPGINCEACHGPGSEHIKAFTDFEAGTPYDDLRIIDTKKFNTRQRSEMCAPCHAKMYPLSNGYQPGEKLFDHYGLHTLEHIDFYPDGRDLGENFTYTPWMLSPCANSGELDCVYCHTSSGRNRFSGDRADQACAPCHQEVLNDPASHTFHEASSEGSRCVSCHMPRTEFARMIRHDHSMLGPTPKATIEFESPNACNLCHQDQSAEWADQWARKWYGETYQDTVMHRSRLLQSARKGEWESLEEIIEYITGPESEEVYTASLVRLLSSCSDPRKWPALEEVFRSPSPLIRAAVVDGIVMHPETETVLAMLLEAVESEFRLVRIRAAAVLSDYPLEDMLTVQQQEKVSGAFRELESSLRARPDDWSSHYNLGNFFAGRGQFDDALRSYGQAGRFRPDEVPVLVNQSMVYARTGDNENAERILREAVRIEPDNTAACFNLGLLLAEQGKLKEAEYFLREALAADPEMAEAAHNLAVLIAGERLDEAIGMSRLAARVRPENPRYSYTLSFFLHQKGKTSEASEILEGLIKREPGFASAYPLLGSILEASGRFERAGELYRKALELPGISPGERDYFGRKAEQMKAMKTDE